MSYLNKLADKLYDQTGRGWLGGKINDLVGEDYQKHLINTTLTGGIPGLGYAADYQQAKNEGDSGWNRVGDNAKKSAAILASIFGGAALANGGGAGAGAGGGGAVPVEEAGFQAGTLPSGGGWTAGADGGGFGQGAGSGGALGANWQQRMGDALKNFGGSQQNQQPSSGSSSPMYEQPAFVNQPEQPPGTYSSAPTTASNPYGQFNPIGYDNVVRSPEQLAALKKMQMQQSALTGGLYGLGEQYA